ncbi:hypothetical protein [Candidatus Mycobacterium methanotrophicum]|uniref:Uncharacterized protein n=1 Tax=Candidatus Mycobacterium methanotrophicum TaxID=2943498 RepID=A0ABY4QP53_9MYCO|nr:hypothetical protein [Candidatus Mycobacterium methanotrophicum]UQX11746.1 hypothetical protein M5I08_04755 [Candidatus Mycobacterium methanotrophicum]
MPPNTYGEDQDLYIAEQIAVDDVGSVQSDEDGKPIYLVFGLLISWSELDYVEFVDIPDDDGSGDDGTERRPERRETARRKGRHQWRRLREERRISRWAEADERCFAGTCNAEGIPHPAAAGQAPQLRQIPSAGIRSRGGGGRCLHGTVTQARPRSPFIHRQ